jgi:hypothetical protein
MNSDNYEFSKSSAPQSTSAYSPYVDKQNNYINDINNGVYSNNSGLTLVQWDLTSIYNSAGFSDASDLYLAVPVVMNAAYSTDAAVVAPATSASYGLLSMKSNYQHLIHQLEITCNGKVCEQMQPFISVAKNFQLLSTMSATDLKSMSISLGMSDTLDNERSVQWNTIASASRAGGVGLCNNRAFGNSGIGSATEQQLLIKSNQNDGTVNGAIQKRISRITDASKAGGASYNCIYSNTLSPVGADNTPPAIMTAQQLSQEFKPYHTVVNNIMTWYDVGLIPLKYISDFIDKLGLVKKLDLVIRAYFNTGSLRVPIGGGVNTNGLFYGAHSNSTFANTCPFTVNLLNDTLALGGVPTTTTYIAAGLFIGRTPTTSIGAANVNLALSGGQHPMPACRCYYSQVKLDPARALSYVQENAEKQIVFEQVLFNQYSAITAGSAFSQLVQSGIRNPTSVLIIPFISSTTLTTVTGGVLGGSALGFSQYASPYDTSPSSYAPLSLINLQVTLGGVNILNTNLNYTYENFLTQVVNAESLTSSDIGIATGLITQQWWEMNRVYFVDLTRGRSADKEMPRNLNISFNNNTNIPIDIMVFTTYLDKVVINIETGQLRKV